MKDLFNYQKLAENLKLEILAEQRKDKSTFDFDTNLCNYEIKGDFILFYGQIYDSNSTYKMKVYTLKVYAISYLSYIYTDSNVIDIKANYTFECIFSKCKNFIKAVNNSINTI